MDFLNKIELISKLSPIITLVLSSLIIAPISNVAKTFNNRRSRKINNTKEIEFLLDKLDDNFKNNFVLKDFKENYFFLQTGIETNEKSIDSFIKLKDNLKGNYTWKKIKLAMPYFKFENELIIIKIKPILKYFAIFTSIISILFFLISFTIIFYFTSEFQYFSMKDFLKLFILVFMPVACGYYLLKVISPLNMAIAMEKRLNKYKLSSS